MSVTSKISNAFSWLLALAIPVLMVSGYFYFFQTKPCEAPITYRVGTFDSQFGLSKTDFLAAIDEASAIWEKSIGRDLFVYDSKGELQVNLVFDARQKDTQDRQEISASIDQTESLYKAKRASLDALNAQYKSVAQAYEAMRAEFESKADAYEAEVRKYNRQGGAPQSEYERLTQEKNELLAMQSSLETKRLAVNTLADQIRTLTDQVNALAKETNSKVAEYNSGDFIGKEFDAGLYTRDAKGERITIYQFENQAKLVRVVAHELGHALGLEHNGNPQSIMYELNQGDKEKLTADDLKALKILCGLQTSK